ncbi:hypothetical protein [Novosphingobium pentaromativorans]|nr:hypothetical protein [Novosphingobium pentaromativorans]
MKPAVILAGLALTWLSVPTTAPHASEAAVTSELQVQAIVRSAGRRPMALGAASNFSQGWNAATFAAARELPVHRFRDGIRWSEAERIPGHYSFDNKRTGYITKLGASGPRLTLTLNWGNPLYDHGKTPHSREAIDAFGRFAAAVIAQFPAVDRLEIGNEFNGGNFVNGPVAKAGLDERRRYHLAMVRSAAKFAKVVRPDVLVLGGATHSMPAGYLWPLLQEDSPPVIEGLAVHPYTTAIDQLARQIAVLRRSARAADMPLYVTEFASRDPARAADDLVRAYATLSSAGAREMDWYPLNERGDGQVPLLDRDQRLTDAGRAFGFVQRTLASQVAIDLSPDPFTFIHAFGPRTWVLWGAKRPLTVDTRAMEAFDAKGGRLPTNRLAIAPDRAIILVGSQSLRLGKNVHLGCNALIADSYSQLAYPAANADDAARFKLEKDGFERFVLSGGRELPFRTMPGQQERHVPWNPYLGRREFPSLRLTADTMAPALPLPHEARARKAGPDLAGIVHRYIARQSGRLVIKASFRSSQESGPEVQIALNRNAMPLLLRSARSQVSIDRAIDAKRGDRVSLAVTVPAGTKTGPITYRIQLYDPDKCPTGAVSLAN